MTIPTYGFRAWLKSMRLRPDPIGDLSRDLHREWSAGKKKFPAHPKTVEQVVQYLHLSGACDEAVEAARDAWAEYFGVSRAA